MYIANVINPLKTSSGPIRLERARGTAQSLNSATASSAVLVADWGLTPVTTRLSTTVNESQGPLGAT